MCLLKCLKESYCPIKGKAIERDLMLKIEPVRASDRINQKSKKTVDRGNEV